MSSKLRTFETLGFRPESEAQQQLILDAQAATGLRMADLLRRAVLNGLPAVVAEIKAQQQKAIAQFETALHEHAAVSKQAERHK